MILVVVVDAVAATDDASDMEDVDNSGNGNILSATRCVYVCVQEKVCVCVCVCT